MILTKYDAFRAFIPRPICFTNGCFDILVPQHVRLIQRCRRYGTVIVSVNDDASVRKLKGDGRPIVCEKDRLEIIDGIKGVSYCFLNCDNSPLESIVRLRPEFLVKGEEFHEAEIIGAAEVRSWGGQVIRFPGSLNSLHSTDIIVKCRATARDPLR